MKISNKLPDDVMVIFVERRISRDHSQAQLQRDEHEFGSLNPNPGFGDMRPIRSQKCQNALGPTNTHAAPNCQGHQQAITSWHEQHRHL